MKKKVMLHLIMPHQVSGPNNAARRINDSFLSNDYEFSFLIQDKHAGGKINISLIKSLMKQIEECKPDLIHLSGLQSSGFHAVVATRLVGMKNILLTVRGFSEDSSDSSKIKKFFLSSVFENLTLLLSSKVTIVTKESLKKRKIRRIGKNKFAGIVHNAAPLVKDNVRISRENLGFSESDFIVIIVGRMVYDKGVSFVAEAAKNMKHNSIKFLFLGDGPLEQFIKSEYSQEVANGRIKLLGSVENVSDYLSISDVFLFATLHENLSNALLEAMAVGLPVICTKVGGNLEVVEENVNGYFINPSDSKDIEMKIMKMFLNRDQQQRFSENSKKIITEKFSQEIIYHQLKNIYESML
ncbi:glycosyltransferase [Vagococcus fluvialis]|uniref:glycosyltransferase n=1 Tax=Vagococcus fluvialis TaxID=2738 RepID=UPI003D104846